MSSTISVARGALLLVVFIFTGTAAVAQNVITDDPVVRSFTGNGFGSRHADAPEELEAFGRLAGIWRTEQEILTQDGDWVRESDGLWMWKYALDGFAVQDLWYQNVENLPEYLEPLGRHYLLTASRIYDPEEGVWNVAWMANGAGEGPGKDFGVMTARADSEAVVMRAQPTDDATMEQRIVFSEITDDTFNWRSDYSLDGGQTWRTVMRVHATRLCKPEPVNETPGQTACP